MESIDGFILVGGASRRMGANKSLLRVGELTFIERIARELDAVTPSITVVGRNAELQSQLPNNLPMVSDVYRDWGALGGVHAALSACTSPWALIVACDFPFVSSELFIRLASARRDFEAVAPIQSDLIPQPLCALYRAAPCLVQVETLIKCGERKPVALLQSVRTRWMAFQEISDLEGAANFFDNINTPADYARIAEKGDASEATVK